MGVRIILSVLTGFAAAWAWAAVRLSGGPPGLALLPIAVSAALLAWGWRGAPAFPSRGRNVGRVVGIWSSIEVAALLVTANMLQTLGRGDLIFPLAAVIVGLHFFPLARGIPVRLYYATGAGFLFAGVAGLLVPPPERPMMVGMSAALTLWATALMVAQRARKNRVSASVAQCRQTTGSLGLAFLFFLCSTRMRGISSPAVAPTPICRFIPTRARRDGWTIERQRAFIATLISVGCVRLAAAAAGMSRESAYRLRRRKGAESFAAAWDSILAARPRGTSSPALVWHRLLKKAGGRSAVRIEDATPAEREALRSPAPAAA